MEKADIPNIYDTLLPMSTVEVNSCHFFLKISNLKTFNSKLKNIICFVFFCVCEQTELMTIFATYNNGAFYVSNDNSYGDGGVQNPYMKYGKK